jgi:translation initiation factor IF-1
METTEIRNRLASMSEGAKVRVRLDDGTEIAGTFGGTEGDQVHIVGADDVDVDRVETVLMDVSSDGVE